MIYEENNMELDEELFNPYLFNDALTSGDINQAIEVMTDPSNLNLKFDEIKYSDFLDMTSKKAIN